MSTTAVSMVSLQSVATAASNGTSPQQEHPTNKKQHAIFVIERSPYEAKGSGPMRRSAENGEVPFDRLLRMLDPKSAKRLLDRYDSDDESDSDSDDDDESTAMLSSSAKSFPYDPALASLLGGDQNAEIMARAYDQIERTGMCFSAEWLPTGDAKAQSVEVRTSSRYGTGGGASRGNKIGLIKLLPPPFVLLCLRPERIAKAGDAVLREISIGLNCQGHVFTALVDLGLADEYPNLRAAATPYHFGKASRACYKCVVFIARTVAVLQLLEQWQKHNTVVEDSLMTKLRACMRILENSVRVDPLIAKKFQRSNDRDVVEEEDIPPDPAKANRKAAPKRTRTTTRSDSGPADKKQKAAPSSPLEVSDTTESSSTNASDSAEKDSKVSSISHSVSQPAASNSVSSSIGDSLREQHERLSGVVEMLPYAELKTQHERLGESISNLRDQIQLDPATLREQWKEEMRQEILEARRKKAANRSSKKKKRERSK